MSISDWSSDVCSSDLYDPGAMRAQIGVAMQDSMLLSGSVRENIALERSGIDDAEMLRASQLSGTHGFMGQLANGYDLKLADRGDGHIGRASWWERMFE